MRIFLDVDAARNRIIPRKHFSRVLIHSADSFAERQFRPTLSFSWLNSNALHFSLAFILRSGPRYKTAVFKSNLIIAIMLLMFLILYSNSHADFKFIWHHICGVIVKWCVDGVTIVISTSHQNIRFTYCITMHENRYAYIWLSILLLKRISYVHYYSFVVSCLSYSELSCNVWCFIRTVSGY